jgi:mRNA interferase HigB
MARYPRAQPGLDGWLSVASDADWSSIIEVRTVFPQADAATVDSGRTVTVFNIGGNNYRLIVAIHYNTQKVFVREFLTHAEYDRGAWKGRN